MNKNIIAALILGTFAVQAHMIEGTLILKGSIKTRITVSGVKTTCRVKVEKVKNLLEEDSFGNPAYNVRINVGLDGNDVASNRSIKFNQDFFFNNLFKTPTGTEVRDLEYKSLEGASMRIDKQGRLKSISFPSPYSTINCNF